MSPDYEQVTGLSLDQRSDLYAELKAKQNSMLEEDIHLEGDTPGKMLAALRKKTTSCLTAAIKDVCRKRDLQEWIAAVVHLEGEAKKNAS